jgi:hypothetical protein
VLKQPKKKQQEERPSEVSSVFRIQLYPGDRITNDTGEGQVNLSDPLAGRHPLA